MVAREKRTLDASLQRKIEQRAYEIWESEGGPHGRDVDHWLRAKAEITGSAIAIMPPSKLQKLHAKPKAKRRSRDLRRGKASRP